MSSCWSVTRWPPGWCTRSSLDRPSTSRPAVVAALSDQVQLVGALAHRTRSPTAVRRRRTPGPRCCGGRRSRCGCRTGCPRGATVGPDPEDLAGQRILAAAPAPTARRRPVETNSMPSASNSSRPPWWWVLVGMCRPAAAAGRPGRPADADPGHPVVRGAGEVGEQRVLVAGRQRDAEQAALPDPDGASTPETSPSRVTLPFGVICSSRPELRSETSASPERGRRSPTARRDHRR